MISSTPRYIRSARRLLDIVIATFGLLIMAPVLLVVCVAIWLENGRPLFFSQVRIGRGGKPFRIHKFRKFRNECGSHGCRVSVKNDPRLSRVGAILEVTKFNEMPQLWNILKGEMSIVGPRPESLDFADCLSDHYSALLKHRPGIFGPSQFYFRNEGELYPRATDPEQFYRDVLFPLKANIDLAYFRKRTLIKDISWIIRGSLVVLGLRRIPDKKFEAMLAGWVNRKDFTLSAKQADMTSRLST